MRSSWTAVSSRSVVGNSARPAWGCSPIFPSSADAHDCEGLCDAVLDEALSAFNRGLLRGARRPAEEAFGLLGGVAVAAAEGNRDRSERGVEPGRDAHDDVRQFPGRDLRCAVAESDSEDSGDVRHPDERSGAEESLPGRGG